MFQADAPDARRIPPHDLLGVTVILLSCFYKEKEFIRVGLHFVVVGRAHLSQGPFTYCLLENQIGVQHLSIVLIAGGVLRELRVRHPRAQRSATRAGMHARGTHGPTAIDAALVAVCAHTELLCMRARLAADL